jgi:hypothetical protein
MNSSAVSGTAAILWRCALAMVLSFICNEARANIFTYQDVIALNVLRSDAVHMIEGLPFTTGAGFYTADDMGCSTQFIESLLTVSSSLEEAMVIVKISSEMKTPDDESVVNEQGALRALLGAMIDIRMRLEPIAHSVAVCSKAEVIVRKAASISGFVDRSAPILKEIYAKIPGHDSYRIPKDIIPKDLLPRN